MERFRGVDYYGVETLLSDEERMVRDAVRDWVDAEFLPVVTEHHRAGTFPMALVPQLGALGLFGATLKGYGCAGLSNVAYGLIMQELERGDSGLRSFASVQSGLVMYPIYRFGSEAQHGADQPLLARHRQPDLRPAVGVGTLDGIDALEPSTVVKALDDQSRDVRASAVRLAERWLGDPKHPIQAAVLKKLDDRDWAVRRQLAATLGTLPDAAAKASALATLLELPPAPSEGRTLGEILA